MTPPRLTGHPDFIPYGSTPVAVLVAQDLNVGTGAWTMPDISVTSGGAYLIAIGAHTLANVVISDVTVQHVDVNGLVIYSDFFGAVMNGNGIPAQLTLPNPTILRGNIYGSVLRISGLVATSAQINGIMGVAGLVASNLDVNVYIIPINLSDPDPRMSNGGANFGGATGISPGSLLQVYNGTVIPFGTNTGINPIIPYSGPAKLCLRYSGALATGVSLRITLNGWAISNYPNSIFSMNFSGAAQFVGEEFDINIPSCLVTTLIGNADPAVNATVNCTLVADRTA
jgi:hypothetical protein